MPIYRCGDCVFWRRLASEPKYGNCLRRAPAPTIAPKSISDDIKRNGSALLIPVRGIDEGCGEGEKKT
jgi:hypothetical protein